MLPLVLMAIISAISAHGFTPHEVFTGRTMRTPEHWWLWGVPPDNYQPRVLMDEFMKKLLTNIREMQKQVTQQLKANIRYMDKR